MMSALAHFADGDRMYALRVKARGRPTIVVGLAQQEGLLSVGASWRWRPNSRAATSCFQATGIDDRMDHLEWLRMVSPPVGSYLDLTVEEARAEPSPPVRKHRRHLDWAVFFADMRTRSLARLAALEGQLNEAPEWLPAQGPLPRAHFALDIRINGRPWARAGIGRPGHLDATVYAKWLRGKMVVALNVIGGTHAPFRVGLRWREFEHRLKVGDRIRMQVVRPVGLTRPEVLPRDTSADPITRAEVRRAIADAQRSLARDRSDMAREMSEADEARPPPRRYPRGRVVR